MSILIWIIILLYFKGNSVVSLHYGMYTLTTHICDAIATNAPSQEVGHWSMAILHTARVIVDPTRGVLFKMLMPPVPPMSRAAIIEYTLGLCWRLFSPCRWGWWCWEGWPPHFWWSVQRHLVYSQTPPRCLWESVHSPLHTTACWSSHGQWLIQSQLGFDTCLCISRPIVGGHTHSL